MGEAQTSPLSKYRPTKKETVCLHTKPDGVHLAPGFNGQGIYDQASSTGYRHDFEPTGVGHDTGRRSVVMFPMLRKSSRLVVQVPPVLRKPSRLVVQVPHSTDHFVINVRLGHKNA
jgi:hypothetical protein